MRLPIPWLDWLQAVRATSPFASGYPNFVCKELLGLAMPKLLTNFTCHLDEVQAACPKMLPSTYLVLQVSLSAAQFKPHQSVHGLYALIKMMLC